MRILVVSDTHGDTAALHQAIFSQPAAEIVIHLGDGEYDVQQVRASFPQKMFLQVCGNCDVGSRLPATGEFTAEGVSIFYTHGHLYHVKWEQSSILEAARQHGAGILLYGHTHVPVSTYENGLHILNPGSLRGFNGSYGFIDITPQGIVTNIVYKNKQGSMGAFH